MAMVFLKKFELKNEKKVVHQVFLYILYYSIYGVYTRIRKHQRLFALIVYVNFLLNLKK